MPTIHVDGRSYEVRGDQNLLAAITDLRINLPYFCWHPAMGSIGACRQCAVKIYHDEADKTGRIVMACMTPVTEGLRVSVRDPEVVEFRRRVIEWLMVNHPHDCPVCDEGGECHLQDMTVMTGHVYRRFRGRKRTYRNQDLGPFVNHEMNRCIQCYRCVRFYRDYAGGRDFDVFASKNHVFFGRYQDGPLESEFSGNLVEICPTGVFTDKTLKRHYTRKWDLETAPSICVHCGLGCNTIPGARYDMLRRVHARYHPEVNRYFICDRGRYGYEFVNHPDRLRQPAIGRTERRVVAWDEALNQAAAGIASCKRVVAIGSARASLEANYALKALVGDDSFSTGMAATDQAGIELALGILRDGPARSASLADVETADAILILGADPTNEAPLLDLAIRQASHLAPIETAKKLGIPAWDDYPVRDALHQERGKLYIVSVAPMKLDAIATESLRASPPEIAAFAWAMDAALREGTAENITAPGRAGQALAAAKQPLVVVSANGDLELLRAAANISRSLSSGRERPCLLSVVAPECNSVGIALFGGRSVDDVLDEIESGRVDGLVVLENDLFRRAAADRVERALGALRYLVVLDHLPTKTAAMADVVFAAATFAESTGTFVNSEGRAQRFYQVFVPTGQPRPSWRILRDLAEMRQPGSAPWVNEDEILSALAHGVAPLAGALEAAPPASWRDRIGARIARESHRYSGRTAEHAHQNVHEPQPPSDVDAPFTFSMEGFQGEPPPALAPRYWYPGWNSAQSLNRFQIEVGGALHGGVPGRRLIESGAGSASRFAPAQPPAPLGDGEIWVAPRALIYGSEELSRLAEGVASLMPPATARLHPDDAAKVGVAPGDEVRVEADGRAYVLPVQLDGEMARGVAVVPSGYPETAGIAGICRARIGRAG